MTDEKREPEHVVLELDGIRITVNASDEEYFLRLIAAGWKEQEEPVVVGPGFLCGHATRVAGSFGKTVDAT